MKYLGVEIARLRSEMRLSQKDLASGICTQSTISRIEGGDVFPAIDTLLKIASKLKVPVEYFIEMLFYENVLDNEELIKNIDLQLKEQNYEMVISMIEEESLDKDNVWLNSYSNYMLKIASYNLRRITGEECIEGLKESLITSNQQTIQFRFLQIKIENSIANVYSEIGETKKSLYYYNKILKEHTHKNYNDFKIHETLIAVLYNKCKTLYDMQDYDAALETANHGIQQSKTTSFYFLVGQFLYYKGQCLEKKGAPHAEIKDIYQQTLFMFEFQELPFYIQSIKENKKFYLE
ncbi:helix-turn-helix domain-containing protein [Psychrobacillus sp. FSL H8-0510]|uniref:helix-turn-helix domain-containing protein n=1 Tax=Psychrobacillus sp. FSL H8-0510 TaxID=2921394 RepID=UPI0030F72176